jgi:hypothetical protein
VLAGTPAAKSAGAYDAKGKKGATGKHGAKDKDKAGNLVGRMSTLITSDLATLTKGRDFLFRAPALPCPGARR